MLISQTSSEYHSVSVLLSWLVTSRFLLSSFVGALTIALPQHNPLKRRRKGCHPSEFCPRMPSRMEYEI